MVPAPSSGPPSTANRRVLAAVVLSVVLGIGLALSGVLPRWLLSFSLSLPVLVGCAGGLHRQVRPLDNGLQRATLATALAGLTLIPALGCRAWAEALAFDDLAYTLPEALGQQILRGGARGGDAVGALVLSATACLRVLGFPRWLTRVLTGVGIGIVVEWALLHPTVLHALGGPAAVPWLLSAMGVHAAVALAVLPGAWITPKPARPALILLVTIGVLGCTGGPWSAARVGRPGTVPGMVPLPPALRFGGPPSPRALVEATAPDEGPDSWPCLDRPSRRTWSRRIRAGATVVLPADAPAASLLATADQLRRRSIVRLGVLGQPTPALPPGLATALLGYPVVEVLLDRPPVGTWALSGGPPPVPTEACLLDVPAETLQQLVITGLDALRAGCESLALPPSTVTAPTPCPANP